MSIIIEKFTRRRSNTLFGFVDVLLPQTHLRVHDVTVHQKNDKRWVGLPAKPMIDREGVALKDENGKVKYVPILQFDSREASDAFSRSCIAAVLKHSPDAFDGA